MASQLFHLFYSFIRLNNVTGEKNTLEAFLQHASFLGFEKEKEVELFQEKAYFSNLSYFVNFLDNFKVQLQEYLPAGNLFDVDQPQLFTVALHGDCAVDSVSKMSQIANSQKKHYQQ